MIGTGTGTSAPKVTSQSDAPLDGHVSAAVTQDTGNKPAAKTFDAVKEEMLAKAAALPATPKPVPAKVEVPALDDKAVADEAKLATDQIAAKRQAKADEQAAMATKLATDIAAAVAAGDHVGAAKLAGIDVDKLNTQAIAAAAMSPEQREIAELRARLDALTAPVAKPAETHPDLAKGREAAADEIAKDTAKYPTIAANRADIIVALVRAETAYNTKATEQKRALTKEEADVIIADALTKAEADAVAKVAAKHTEHSQGPVKAPQPRSLSKSLPSKPLSFDDAKALIWRK